MSKYKDTNKKKTTAISVNLKTRHLLRIEANNLN